MDPVLYSDSQDQPLIDILQAKFQEKEDNAIRLPLASMYVKRFSIQRYVAVLAWTHTYTSQVLKGNPENRRFHAVLPGSVALKFANALGDLLLTPSAVRLTDTPECI